MKKNYYRNSISFYLILLLYIAIFISALCVVVLSKLTIFEYIIFGLGLVVSGLSIVELLIYKISLYEDYVYVGKDYNIMLLRVQHKVILQYEEIANIDLDFSTTNSQQKSIRGKTPLNRYLNFTLQNGKHKRICINYYSKKRVLNLVQEIANRSNIQLSEKLVEDINKLIKF